MTATIPHPHRVSGDRLTEARHADARRGEQRRTPGRGQPWRGIWGSKSGRLDRRRRSDRGSISLEVAILGVVLLLIVLLAAAAGRGMIASNTVADAAFDAARAASLQTTASGARAEAHHSASVSLDGNGLRCTAVEADVDVSGFASPVATNATVTVTIRCTLSNAQLTAVPGLPAQTTLRATASSPLDRFRTRSPA